MNHSTTMLCLYAGAALLASLAGGSLPSLVRLTHTRMQTAISFIGGLMLGMALLHMIPHAAAESHSVDRAVGWALGGFLCIACSDLLPELHFHAHDRLRLSLALMAGLAVSILVGVFEGHSHDHDHNHSEHSETLPHTQPHSH